MKRVFLVLCCFLTGSILTSAQNSGPNSPLTYSTSGTGSSWANLGGILSVDNNPAYVDLAQFPTCNSFMCYYSNTASFTGFGFAIPLTATITGIQVDAMQRVSSPGGGIHDSVLVLILNGTAVSSNYADPTNWLDTPTMNTYGDSTDTWAYSWVPAEINDPSFGLEYSLTNDSYDQPASLDFLSMTVYYQTGTGIKSQTSKPWQIGFVGSKLKISAEGSTLVNGVRVDVRNIEGKLYFSQDIDTGQNNLDLNIDASAWDAGLFVVNIVSAEGSNYQKKVVLIK